MSTVSLYIEQSSYVSKKIKSVAMDLAMFDKNV